MSFAYPTAADAATATTTIIEYFEGSASLADSVKAGWIVQGFAQSQILPSASAMATARQAVNTATKTAKAQFFKVQQKNLETGKLGIIPWAAIIAEILALLEQFLSPPTPVPTP